VKPSCCLAEEWEAVIVKEWSMKLFCFWSDPHSLESEFFIFIFTYTCWKLHLTNYGVHIYVLLVQTKGLDVRTIIIFGTGYCNVLA
jgi:hypothetical protein